MTVVFIIESSMWFFCIFVLYIDDMMTVTVDMFEVDKLKAQLNKEFEMKDLSVAKKILGMKIHRNRQEEKLFLSQ